MIKFKGIAFLRRILVIKLYLIYNFNTQLTTLFNIRFLSIPKKFIKRIIILTTIILTTNFKDHKIYQEPLLKFF